MTASTLTGDLDIVPGSALQYGAGVHDINTSSPLVFRPMAGTIRIAGGTVNVNNAGTDLFSSTSVVLASGELDGGGDLTINGLFTWEGGDVSINELITTGTVGLDTSATKTLMSLWTNRGVVNFNDGIVDVSGVSGTLTNHGQFNIISTDSGDTLQGTGTFNNTASGTLTKANAGTITLQPSVFMNNGLVDVVTDTLVIQTDITNAGVMIVDVGAILDGAGTSFTNDSAGVLEGNGSIRAPTGGLLNSGLLRVGSSIGALTIVGDLILDVTSLLEIELGGSSLGGVDYDLLSVTGNITVDGTLDVTEINGFSAILGDRFRRWLAAVVVRTV